MRKTSIVIPTYNGLPLLSECVEAIRAHTDAPYEIIVVDNGSTDGTLEYCIRERLVFASFARNMGFPVACNLGLKMGGGEALLLMNNDVLVSKGWLPNMLACLDSSQEIGIVGPYTNYASGVQMKAPSYEGAPQFFGSAEAQNVPDPASWREVNRLVGLCFLFKRELMDRIGFLDERFSPGHYEDDDYCYRARLAGYKLMLAGDTYVHHHGSASFKKRMPEEVFQLVTDNHRKFMEKWGIDPQQFIEG
ncbi:glycosyltransferase family 2 protein [Gorillibacterium sp. sgz5001074]|uniref:glycosyltransferase family 2 protein n=1 Tax=Gorillibacterium sp. sgz5001074 TaxID=3446695 RepID=UPI003F666C13